jgi:hypothetical protein
MLLLVCPATANQVSYFPPGILGEKPELSRFKEQWYSKELQLLREPSLWELSKTQKSESYRFLWLRSFHPGIAIRIDLKADGSSIATIKIDNEKGKGEPTKLVKNKVIRLTEDQTQFFLDRVSDAQFWSLPTLDKTEPIHVDGAQWIIEGVKNGKYLILDRWSPKAGPVHDLGTYMLFVVADLKLLYTDVY